MNKKLFLTYFLLGTCAFLNAQNVGIGTLNPSQKLDVKSTFIVSEDNTVTVSLPTASQTISFLCNGTTGFQNADSTGKFTGSCGSFTTSYVTVPASTNSAIRIHVDFFNPNGSLSFTDVSTGSSLLSVSSDQTGAIVGGNHDFMLAASGIKCRWTTTSLNNNSCAVTFRRVYPETGVFFGEPTDLGGNAFYYNARKGILRSGFISSFPANGKAGDFSASIGYESAASGTHSAAIGFYAKATGPNAVSLGDSTTSAGEGSIAIGNKTNASGDFSTAMGSLTTAAGDFSTAIGYNTQAAGNYSLAAGKSVVAGFPGSMYLGDSDPNNKGLKYAQGNNQLFARFNGGYYFLSSNAGADIGAQLLPGNSSWSTISDVRRKENFLPVNGESFLEKIAVIPLTTWNYIGTSPGAHRHYGPMAQDFYAAFGKDDRGAIGCDTLINEQDFIGVNFIAVQALEKRTTDLKKENAEMKMLIVNLCGQVEGLKKQLNRKKKYAK